MDHDLFEATQGPLRVLVTGTREVTDGQANYVRYALNWATEDARAAGRAVVIIEGEAPGVDTVSRQWAEASPGVTVEPHRAQWDRFGKAAGPMRNAEMVAAGADVCMAFPGPESRGTWDCIKRAVGADIVTMIFPLGPVKLKAFPYQGIADGASELKQS
jgi:hypothetical protein